MCTVLVQNPGFMLQHLFYKTLGRKIVFFHEENFSGLRIFSTETFASSTSAYVETQRGFKPLFFFFLSFIYMQVYLE